MFKLLKIKIPEKLDFMKPDVKTVSLLHIAMLYSADQYSF